MRHVKAKLRPLSGKTPTTYPEILLYAQRVAKEEGRIYYIGPDWSLYINRPPKDKLAFEVYPGGRTIDWRAAAAKAAKL